MRLIFKCENYHLPASACVKKDLKKRSVMWMFCVFNKILIVLILSEYTS